MRHIRPAWPWLLAGVGALITAVLCGAAVGAAGIPPWAAALDLLSRLPLGIESPLTPRQSAVLTELRLPRVLVGAAVGGLLALAGAGYQGVFRNPLADPYLLGAASGAGVGATLVILHAPGLSLGPLRLIPLAAFVGALLGVVGAYVLGSLAGRGGTAALVLSGVAVSSFLSAVQSLLQMTRTEDLRRVYSWIMGGLGRGGWEDLRLIAPYALVATVVLLCCAPLLDLLALGDDKAASLGLNPALVRLLVISAASLATAAAVSVSGLIGFVGIVVPHLVRRLVGSGHHALLPMSLLVGAAFLVLADIVARTLLAPAELPLGVVTAFIGAPFFVMVLRATRDRVA
ncbi:FecCD family ABC transporter permease [Marinactinospora thermotolerans]|uniref:Iron complex transport system permease protein n=1 Tax=Marinactinospora thermotolerans DSM 45154 TaxID=1122192 RepID=A0A1T4SFH0_9ACTN|nr:iron complex transport system permease protein [Marinactinospora thermotolerans DSM 45154]